MTDQHRGDRAPAVADTEPRRRIRTHVTIHDVARGANVTVGTVSKALNRSGSLKQETRDRIITIARQLGFRPNDLAQSLHRGQSLTVGLISTDSFGRFTIPIMEGLEECLADQRMAVFMCNATDDPEREAQHVESLVGKRVDGIVVTARRADRRPELAVPASDIPVIYVFCQIDDPDGVCLLPDDEGGAALATNHLIRLGRRRIAHVSGPERFEAVRLRRDGYRNALAEAGLDAPGSFYLPGVWSEGWGREATAQLFATDRVPPDAIFCGNDQIARGMADALRERGISVPNEVSIVGFDNWEIIAAATRPPLTTIDMNLTELGREAGRRLIRMIAGEPMHGVHRLPCSLIVRESCGASSGAPAGEQRAIGKGLFMRRLAPVRFTEVTMEGTFWHERLETVLAKTIPSQHGRLVEHGILASLALPQPVPPLRIPPNRHDFTTQIFWDSDVGKWIEAASYALAHRRDPTIESQIDAIVDTLARAQAPDGYLNCWYLGREPDKRWTNLRDNHELYCAGHMLEGAVAYFQATGRRRLLDIMCRYVDHIAAVFGPGTHQKRGYCGHQEIELALIKLYRVTGDRKHLDLASYFIDERGKQPHYFDTEARHAAKILPIFGPGHMNTTSRICLFASKRRWSGMPCEPCICIPPWPILPPNSTIKR